MSRLLSRGFGLLGKLISTDKRWQASPVSNSRSPPCRPSVDLGEAHRVGGIQVRSVAENVGGCSRYCRPNNQYRVLASFSCGRLKRRGEFLLILDWQNLPEPAKRRMFVSLEGIESRHQLAQGSMHRLCFRCPAAAPLDAL